MRLALGRVPGHRIILRADARLRRRTTAGVLEEIVERMILFIEQADARGVPIHRITRHMLGLFQGQPRARAWRRHLSENAHLPGAGPEVVEQALQFVN